MRTFIHQKTRRVVGSIILLLSTSSLEAQTIKISYRGFFINNLTIDHQTTYESVKTIMGSTPVEFVETHYKNKKQVTNRYIAFTNNGLLFCFSKDSVLVSLKLFPGLGWAPYFYRKRIKNPHTLKRFKENIYIDSFKGVLFVNDTLTSIQKPYDTLTLQINSAVSIPFASIKGSYNSIDFLIKVFNPIVETDQLLFNYIYQKPKDAYRYADVLSEYNQRCITLLSQQNISDTTFISFLFNTLVTIKNKTKYSLAHYHLITKQSYDKNEKYSRTPNMLILATGDRNVSIINVIKNLKEGFGLALLDSNLAQFKVLVNDNEKVVSKTVGSKIKIPNGISKKQFYNYTVYEHNYRYINIPGHKRYIPLRETYIDLKFSINPINFYVMECYLEVGFSKARAGMYYRGENLGKLSVKVYEYLPDSQPKIIIEKTTNVYAE